MDYNIVSKGAKDAISAYFRSPEQYEQGLKTFYAEGVKNPSVARILFHDEGIKNAKECIAEQKKLSKEYDEFKPSTTKVKPSDFKPIGIMQEMIAESASDFVNTITEGLEHLKHSYSTINKLIINKIRLTAPLKILDKYNAPENLQKEKEAFDTAFDTMYPKTGEIRKKLIYYNIRKDRVTPRIAENKRHYITEPKEGWFEKYPKTASARLDILEGKKPEEPNTWTKIKNFFKSDKKLAKENEAKLEQRKKDYETDKLVRAFSK